MYYFIGKLHHPASFMEYVLWDKPCTGTWEVWSQRQNPSQLLTRNATELARVAPQPNLRGRGPSSWRRSQRSLPNRSGHFEGVSWEGGGEDVHSCQDQWCASLGKRISQRRCCGQLVWTLPCIEGCSVPLCLALNVSSASTSNLLSVCVDFFL